MLPRILAQLRRHRSLLLLLGALALGGLAAFGARNYITGQLALERERLNPRREEIEVVVAKRDLRRGDLVGPDSMAVRRMPREFVGGTVIVPERFEGYVGARLNGPMRSGEPLINQSIDGADTSSFSTKVRSGIRAMTIAVDEVNSISGMLQPGDRIDLQLSVRPPPRPDVGAQPTELTAPLMQDVLVLATGRQVRAAHDEALAGRGYTTITVEVSPDQAQRLIVAQRGGRLTALLRNRDDRHAIAQRPLDIHDLLGVAPRRRSSAGPGLEMIVGGRGPLKVSGTTSAQSPSPGGAAMAQADESGVGGAAAMLLGRLAAAQGGEAQPGTAVAQRGRLGGVPGGQGSAPTAEPAVSGAAAVPASAAEGRRRPDRGAASRTNVPTEERSSP